MLGPDRGAVELEETAPLQNAVDDGVAEVLVVKDLAPSIEGLVGREDHRPLLEMALIDHVVEHVGRVVAVGQVADLVDDEDVRMGVVGHGLAELPLPACDGELLDEGGGRHEVRIEAVLDRAVRDRDGEVSLAATGPALKDEGAPLGHEVGREEGADHRHPDGRLVGEVEVVDGLEEGEPGGAGDLLQSGLLPMGDLLGDEHAEKLVVGPLLLLGAPAEIAPDAPGVREVEPLEERVDWDVGLHSGSTSCRLAGSGWRRKWRTYSAPKVWPATALPMASRSASDPCSWSRS